MSVGEVDTLNLLTDKLDKLFNDSQGYYESFLDANNMFKQGKLSEKEFFEKLGDYVVAYSALEFLAVKVLFEIKKVVDKMGGSSMGTTQSPGLMPGMGGGMSAGMAGRSQPPQQPTQTPGSPPSIVSKGSFSEPGTLPSADPSMMQRSKSASSNSCKNCGAEIRSGAKFCTKCGTKL